MNPPRDERLAQFRAEWPRHVSWAEVRADDPGAFRMAAKGGLLLLAAVPLSLLGTSLVMEFPFTISMPGWLDLIRPVVYIITVWGSIMLWLGGLIMLTMPNDARRAIAIKRFAAARDLGFMRFGFAPPRAGIMFAEGTAVQLPRRLREQARAQSQAQEKSTKKGAKSASKTSSKKSQGGAAGDDPNKPLFRAEFALWTGGFAYEPGLQIAVATYQGSKSDPKGPRNAFRYLTTRLPRDLPHLMIDSRRNGSLRGMLPGTERMSLEGDFDRHFAVYAPKGYERDALELLTPDVMACLIDYGRHWDVEVVEDRLIVASNKVRGWSDRNEITALLRFSELFGDEIGHQAKTYSDPRASHPRSQVAVGGQRLKRRSAAWTTAIFIAIVAAMLAFPHVLGWFLDR